MNSLNKYLVLVFVFLPLKVLAIDIPEVKICADKAEWPPFLYFERVNQQKSKRVMGFSLDVIRHILNRHSIPFELHFLPWSRCQKFVQQGNYHLFLNASFNELRNVQYHLSMGYYQLNYMYYYSNAQYPNGLKIPSKQYVLDNLRQCSIRGSSNSAFDFPPGFINNVADNWDTLQRLLKTRPQLCNFAAAPDAVVVGYIAMGKKSFTDNSLGVGQYPGLKPQSYHMGISKNISHAKPLLQLINLGLTALVQDGTYRRLLKKHKLPDAVIPANLMQFIVDHE